MIKYVELDKNTNEWVSGPFTVLEMPNPEMMHTIPVQVDESVVECFSGQIYDPETRLMVHTDISINKMCLEYLANTDWYVIRKSETGKEIPQEVLDRREEYRSLIYRNTNETS